MPAVEGDRPHVLILGGGFGGLNAARALAKAPVRVTVIDRRNHHLFQPLLYQVASAVLNPSDIASPIRSILAKQKNARVYLFDAVAIEPAARRVRFRSGREMTFDYLIVATGATHSYFGHPEWERFAPGLKTIEDAIEIRRRVVLAFEEAEREEDPAKRKSWLTFVVIGGGPTGVELAGAFAEIAFSAVGRVYRNFDPAEAKVVLLEGLPRILPVYPPDLSEKARQQLEGFEVEVRTGTRVTGIDEEGVSMGEERIETRTVVWAAGVQASPIARSLGAPLDKAGRVKVTEDLSVPGIPNIFVIGDLASFEQEGGPVPGVAPAAIQEGKWVARNIRRDLAGESREPFRYRDKGSLATIGQAAAVADLGWLHLSGFPAWFAWVTIHIFFLIGFRNRLIVVLQWAWGYLTRRRPVALITGENPVKLGLEDEEATDVAGTSAR